MSHTLRYVIESSPSNGAGEQQKFEAVRMGAGAYAQVFLAREERSGVREPIKTLIVAKVFHDAIPEDANAIFHQEVEILDRLREQNTIVGLRGIDHRRSPTFVCEECGDVFSVDLCPQCASSPLRNEDEIPHFRGRKAAIVLHCTDGGHQYQAKDHTVDTLLSKRPCGHTGPCDIVNFLFRPCIYLDLLHVNLREFSDLAAGRDSACRGHSISTLCDPEQNRDGWLREVFLMRLSALVQVAEGLDQVHRRGHVHGDIAPDNIMVSFGTPLDANAPQGHFARLIDFGQARNMSEPRVTGLIKGRHNYIAPEVLTVENPMGQTARIQMLPGSSECILTCQSQSEPLEEGDYLSDNQGSSYVVVNALYGDDHSSSFDVRDSTRYNSYLLRVRELPVGIPPAGTLRANYSIRAPADIYSFGCVIAWILTDGADLVKIRSIAQTAAAEYPDIDRAFEFIRSAQTYTSLLNRMPLPQTEEDNEVRRRVMEVVFRCLMRVEGAYARKRSADFDGAAARIRADLASVYEYLYFTHRTNERFRDFLSRDQQRYVDTWIQKARAAEEAVQDMQARLDATHSELLDVRAKVEKEVHETIVKTQAALADEKKKAVEATREWRESAQREEALASKLEEENAKRTASEEAVRKGAHERYQAMEEQRRRFDEEKKKAAAETAVRADTDKRKAVEEAVRAHQENARAEKESAVEQAIRELEQRHAQAAQSGDVSVHLALEESRASDRDSRKKLAALRRLFIAFGVVFVGITTTLALGAIGVLSFAATPPPPSSTAPPRDAPPMAKPTSVAVAPPDASSPDTGSPVGTSAPSTDVPTATSTSAAARPSVDADAPSKPLRPPKIVPPPPPRTATTIDDADDPLH